MSNMIVDNHKRELKIEDVVKKQQARLEVYKKLSERTGLRCFPVVPTVEDINSINDHLRFDGPNAREDNRSAALQSNVPSLSEISSRIATREVLLDFSQNKTVNFDIKQEFLAKKTENGTSSVANGGDDDDANNNSLTNNRLAIHLIEEQTTKLVPHFLPGDCLIEVNGRSVEDLSASQVLQLITRCKSNHQKVLLKVRPLPELNELSTRMDVDGGKVSIGELLVKSRTLKRSGSLRMRRKMIGVTSRDESLDSEVVWIKHEVGFTSAIVVGKNANDGKIRVRLDQGQIEMEVDESDVEKANSAAYDRIENLSSLRFVNESSCLHTLRHRYHSNLTHTFSGDALIVMTPMSDLCIYSEKIMAMFKGCNSEDVIPHIYATAQASYSAMIGSRKDQAILLLGPSGGGKSTNLFHLLQYFTSVTSLPTYDQVKAMNINATSTVLSAFSNCRTILNANATRCVQVAKLSFDKMGYLCGIAFQAVNLENNRLSQRPEGEPTFHIFYQMLAGIDAKQRKELHLDRIHEPNVLMTPLHDTKDQKIAKDAWIKIVAAMETLEFEEQEIHSILVMLAAIFHVGSAGVIRGETREEFQFARPAAARRAANLLGCSMQDISKAIFNRSQLQERKEMLTGLDCIGSFVGDLYSHLFHFVISLINRLLAPSMHDPRGATSILIVDPPGSQNPQLHSRCTGMFDLECNYINERLALLCHNALVTSRIKLIKEELGEVYPHINDSSKDRLLKLLRSIDGVEYDNQLAGRSNTKDRNNNNNTNASSLFEILNEASFNSSSTSQFMESLKSLFPASSSSSSQIMVDHLYNTTPVCYDVQGWVKCNQQVYNAAWIRSFLLRSTRQDLRDTCFIEPTNAMDLPSPSSFSTRVSALIADVDAMLSDVHQRESRFAFCWRPHLASPSSHSPSSPLPPAIHDEVETTNHSTSANDNETLVDVRTLRSRWRGTCLSQATALHSSSYPEHYLYPNFVAKFNILIPHRDDIDVGTPNHKRMTELILAHHNVDPGTYKLGKTRVFFHSGGLSLLNVLCDDAVTKWVIALQSFCKGTLARRRMVKLMVETEAMMCIQEAMRSFMALKRWKWWRLFDKLRCLMRFRFNGSDQGTPMMDRSFARFDDGTSTSDIITNSFSNSFLNCDGDDYDDHHHHQQLQKMQDDARLLKLRHLEEMEDLEDAARKAEGRLAHEGIEGVMLDNANKQLQMKDGQLEHLSHLVMQKSLENEDLKGRQKRMERDLVSRDEMLGCGEEQKSQILQEMKRLERDRLSTKQQLEEALRNLEREMVRRKEAEVRTNLLCDSNDEHEQLRQEKRELLRKQNRHLQQLTDQEATIKKLLETMSKLEESGCQARRALAEKGLDDSKASALKEMHMKEKRMEELMVEKEDKIESLLNNELNLMQSMQECKSKFKIKEKKLKQRLKGLADVLHQDQLKMNHPHSIIRVFKSRVTDLEDELEAVRKMKRNAESEVLMIQSQLNSITESKKETDERSRQLMQSNNELSSRLEEKDDEFQELMRKYSLLVQQNSLDLQNVHDQSEELEVLRGKWQKQEEEMQVMQMKLSRLQTGSVSAHVAGRLEANMAEMKTNMEVEAFSRRQAESQLSRLKDALNREKNDRARLQEALDGKNNEVVSQQNALKVQKSRVICLETRLQDLESLITQLRRKIDQQQDECKGHKGEIGLLNRRLMAIQSNASMYWVEDDDDDDDDINTILARGKVLLLSPKKSLLDSSEA